MAKKKHSKEKTFSERAKAIVARYKSRLGENLDKDDPLARKAMERELAELAAEQESVKQSMEMDQMSKAMAYGGGLPQMKKGGKVPQMGGWGSAFMSSLPGGDIFSMNNTAGLSIQEFDRLNPDAKEILLQGVRNSWSNKSTEPQVISAKSTPTINSLGVKPFPQGINTDKYSAANAWAKSVGIGFNPGEESWLKSVDFKKNGDTGVDLSQFSGPGPDPNDKIDWTAWAAPAVNALASAASLAFLGKEQPQADYNPAQLAPYEKADMSQMYRAAKEASIDSQRSISGSDQYTAKAYKNRIATDYQKQLASISAEENKTNTEGLNARNMSKYGIEMQSAKNASDIQLANNVMKQKNTEGIVEGIGRLGANISQFPQNIAQHKMDLQTLEAMSKGNAVLIGNKLWRQPLQGFLTDGKTFWINNQQVPANEFTDMLAKSMPKTKPEQVAK